MSKLPVRPMYLTAGNFPSIAANTIQLAKMAAAYTNWLVNLEVVSLAGIRTLSNPYDLDLQQMFGLSQKLNMRYIRLLWSQKETVFNQDYRPPKWFYHLVGKYAYWNGADLVFTRKDATAKTTLKHKIPTILETHVTWKNQLFSKSLLRLLNGEYLKVLVVITEPIAESFIKAGISEDKIIIEPDGVDLRQFSPEIGKEEARHRLGLKLTSPLCVYSGHLYSERGVDIILKAARQLPHFNFLFIGGWERDVKKYQKISRSMELHNVIFKGYVPHSLIPLHLFAADILLMPYSARLETANRCSPMKMFEYMAAGRAIVASDLPVLHKILQHKKNALFIQPDSVEGLIHALSSLISSSELAPFISYNARMDSHLYSWDERARRILNHIGIINNNN